MAATIAKCFGIDKTGRQKEASRLGGSQAIGQANTWVTFTECRVNADGTARVMVTRNGRVILDFEVTTAEGNDDRVDVLGVILGETINRNRPMWGEKR